MTEIDSDNLVETNEKLLNEKTYVLFLFSPGALQNTRVPGPLSREPFARKKRRVERDFFSCLLAPEGACRNSRLPV